MRPIGSKKQVVLDPSELKRMHARWSEGMAIARMRELHGLASDTIQRLCAGVPRPGREPQRKPGSPIGLMGEIP